MDKSIFFNRIRKLIDVNIFLENDQDQLTSNEVVMLSKAFESLRENIFPDIPVSRDVKKIKVTLRYIATFYFERENGEWELSKIEYDSAEI